jgi:7,8-dihydroneopterin aldolase/epimerase/oxygenase
MSGKVSLEGLEFFAYHGFYAEEQKIGNKYSVDISVESDLQESAQDDDLKKTINYEILYEIIAEVMKEKSKLLEHIGHQIIHAVRRQFPYVHNIEVKVSKFNPPIGGVCHKATVTLHEKFEE